MMTSSSSSNPGKPLGAPAPEKFDIFRFTSSAELITAYVEFKKRTARYFSITGWAKKLRLPTGGILVNMMKKRRLLQEYQVPKMAETMDLDPAETEYLTTLVAWERARTTESTTQVFLERRLQAIRLRAAATIFGDAALNLVSNLRTIAIKELLALKNAVPSPEWIAERLSLRSKPAEIEESFRTLEQCGLLQRDQDGSYSLANGPTHSPNGIPSAALRRFHSESLENAVRVLSEVPIEKRHFTNYTMPIHSNRVADAKRFIENFIDDFAAEFEAKPGEGDEVYQLNLNYIPLSKGPAS